LPRNPNEMTKRQLNVKWNIQFICFFYKMYVHVSKNTGTWWRNSLMHRDNKFSCCCIIVIVSRGSAGLNSWVH
jgi:hypothetical protein